MRHRRSTAAMRGSTAASALCSASSARWCATSARSPSFSCHRLGGWEGRLLPGDLPAELGELEEEDGIWPELAGLDESLRRRGRGGERAPRLSTPAGAGEGGFDVPYWRGERGESGESGESDEPAASLPATPSPLDRKAPLGAPDPFSVAERTDDLAGDGARWLWLMEPPLPPLLPPPPPLSCSFFLARA